MGGYKSRGKTGLREGLVRFSPCFSALLDYLKQVSEATPECQLTYARFADPFVNDIVAVPSLAVPSLAVPHDTNFPRGQFQR